MHIKADFKKKLFTLLKRFNVEELVFVINSVFSSVSLKDVEKLLIELRLQITVNSLTEVILYLYDKSFPSVDDCERILCELYALDASFHITHKWSTVILRNEINELPNKLNDLSTLMVRSYRSKALNANVYSLLLNKTIWTVAVERIILKKGGVKMGPPNYFAFRPDIDEPHVLFSPSNMDTSLHLQIFIESLGFGEYGIVNYEGKNPAGMFECIQRKETSSRALQPFVYEESNEVVLRNEGWLEYSQSENRKSHANKLFSCFTDHKSLTVEFEDLPVDQPLGVSKINDFFSSVDFIVSGKNLSVEKMFHHLVSIGAVIFPLPDYMLNITSTPSNIISV